jgi:hypothetical protein
MSNVSTIAALSAASLVALYNGALEEYGAPEGFEPIAKRTSKAKATEALEALLVAGNLAVNFDGDAATIIDATPESDDAPSVAHGDGKGKVRDWGFALASDDWLKANPRGGADREAYRKARRKAARLNRKAARAAKEAARAE